MPKNPLSSTSPTHGPQAPESHAQAATAKAATPARAPIPSILGPAVITAATLSVAVALAISLVAAEPREAAGFVPVSGSDVVEYAPSDVLTPLLSWARVLVTSMTRVVRRRNFMLRVLWLLGL
jgi:hypothetical protein